MVERCVVQAAAFVHKKRTSRDKYRNLEDMMKKNKV